jgi:DNA polymerase-2
MMVTGWLLDVYTLENVNGLVLWLIGDDGKRYRFEHAFPIAFYAAGSAPDLRALWRFLQSQPEQVRLARDERRDLFAGMIPVLACEVTHPTDLPRLFQRVAQAFPSLTYYDADIHVALRYAAAFQVFPLARCEIEADESQRVRSIHPLDTPWELDPEPPPLRILKIEPDSDPSHSAPRNLIVSYNRARVVLPLEKVKNIIGSLYSTLQCYDPDLILAAWGDTWLLPTLLTGQEQANWRLPLNRESSCDVIHRKEHTYFSYGQIVYRGQQVLLRGRLHIDCHNAMLWKDYDLEGVFEMARVTGLPIQDAARLSPGTGISSMQFITALRQGILIPYHKHQAETPKTALELIRADMGGMVYQPIIGLHKEVAGIDFVSMYPGMMVYFNISPEVPRVKDDLIPAHDEPGIVPQTLKPLLLKRLAFKSALAKFGKYDCRRESYQARSTADKWLLVTCFGYLGYKNARFGRIESHEAVTAYGREALLRAKEAAEDLGFEVLHMYVDGLWVRKEKLTNANNFQELLDVISETTGIPIALDGVYKWIVFLPSKVDSRVPVPNRYFGVFQSGEIKVRGIEARRHDTPPFIAQTQMDMLEILARAPSVDELPEYIPLALALVEKKINELRAGRVPLEDLLIAQKLNRDLEKYRVPSPAARAAMQLVKAGKHVSAGQRMRFLLTRGEPGVYAWDLGSLPNVASLDGERYLTLLLRAANTILEPFRVDHTDLWEWITEGGETLKQIPMLEKKERQVGKYPNLKYSVKL